MTQAPIHMCILLAGVSAATAQAPPPRLAFEVASVKVHTIPSRMDLKPRVLGDRVEMHNTQLRTMVCYAYALHCGYDLTGNLGIIGESNWFDVDAKVEASPADGEMRLMFQSLLEDRFKLEAHRETREMAVYDLVVAKGGPKLAEASAESRLTVDGKVISKPTHGIILGADGQHLTGKSATMAEMVETLREAMQAPVVDRTGLYGTYDYDVVFARENQPDDTAPSLPAALRDGAGLQLVRGQGAVEVLVIDRVQKLSEN